MNWSLFLCCSSYYFWVYSSICMNSSCMFCNSSCIHCTCSSNFFLCSSKALTLLFSTMVNDWVFNQDWGWIFGSSDTKLLARELTREDFEKLRGEKWKKEGDIESAHNRTFWCYFLSITLQLPALYTMRFPSKSNCHSNELLTVNSSNN